MNAKFLRIDGGIYPQIANSVMAPSFAKELTALVKCEQEAAYLAGAEHAAQIVRENSYHGHAGLFACSTDLPCKTCKLVEQILVGESSGAPQEKP